ncbi:unnamed protein product, partial [marine sediment metagenome]
ALAIAGFLTLGSSWQAKATGNASEAGVDVIITDGGGNDDSTVGTTADGTCVEVANDTEFYIDVFVKGIPSDDGVSGYEYDLEFTDGLLGVVAFDEIYLLHRTNGSCTSYYLDKDGTPDWTSPWWIFDSDLADATTCSEPEDGDGVLTRVTMKTHASNTGLATIELSDTYRYIYTLDETGGIGANEWISGRVAVGQDCPAESDPAITGQTIGTWNGSC